MLKTYYVSFWLVLKFPSSWSAAVLCFLAKHRHQAWAGILFLLKFHWGPKDGQKMAVAAWPLNRIEPLLKFTFSWFRIASRFGDIGELAMPMLEQKNKS